jgi:hypothetical protein
MRRAKGTDRIEIGTVKPKLSEKGQRGHVAMVGPTSTSHLKARIIAAVKNFYAPMLKRVWQEHEYLIDVCRVTRVAHIEHL